MTRYLLVKEGQKEFLVQEEKIKAENDLQEVVKKNPELIPVEDLNLLNLLVVGRETSLPSGSIDLMCIDEKGTIVIVEFKKGPENPDSRRVIAQLLDYGSHLWGLTFEEFEGVCSNYFNSTRCTDPRFYRKNNLRDAFKEMWGQGSDETNESGEDESGWENFKEGISRCLSEGSFYCIVASTHIGDILRRTMKYLTQTSSAIFAGIEIDHFSSDGKEIFVPRAYLPGAKPRPTSSRTTMQNFLEKSDPAARQVWENLFQVLAIYGETIYWGKVGFSFRVKVQGRLQSILWGFTRDSSWGIDALQFVMPRIELSEDIKMIFEKFQNNLSFLGEDLIKKSTYVYVVVGNGLRLDNIDKFVSALNTVVEDLRALN
ncbi:endonuclease NucS domain-containing protein [Pelotomaculum propionicicum]|uniref:endonuclease NucS domain-containing protein n=1 Tax=Pelotomaculum propionicicum TaxID=258475 RepID=UPI003B7B4D09